jgi:uncharacterized membrane protein YdbT with pleckstrin-like domain
VSYIEDSLGQNEVVHYRARFHWFYHAAAWGALVIGILIAVLTLAETYFWIALIALAIGVAVWLSIMVPIWTTEIGVTTQRIIYKQGLLNVNTNELQLRSIEEVRFNQDFWGRIFNFGKLEIHGTGDDAIYLPAVADPIGLRAALQEALGAAQGDGPPVEDIPEKPDPNGMHARPA